MGRFFLQSLGFVFLGIAILGVALPLLPTTPFLLLSAACFVRSSPKSHAWLLAHPVWGEHLRNYQVSRGMTFGAKMTSITMLWSAMLYAVFAHVGSFAGRGLLLLVALLVTTHILILKTLAPRKQ